MPEETNQISDQDLRQPPAAGGPNRIQEQQRVNKLNAALQRRKQIERVGGPIMPRSVKKSVLKKALPYLIPGISTVAGIGAVFTDFFS